ncbi:hypothetical protein LTR05_007386 [Lithohypha guttulata]|uniref:DUF7580 domain-containing protein n=1 Tax=Lithohypha guttulata TaxID=1690604 RepID=A0AAN7SV83_9EURO|nr:hypothetical protein LTR05_007386 [Lithohypha guttulata]
MSTYLAINISGNAQAIIGNVYGLDKHLFPDADRREHKVALLQRLEHISNPIEEGLVVVSSQLSVLVLKEYEDAKSLINGFGKYESKIERYAKEIGVRQTIFKQALSNLLDPYTGADTAQEMLCDHGHPTWLEDGSLQYFSDRFGDGIDAVQDVLELISLDLEALTAFGQKCAALKRDEGKEKAVTHLKSKIKTLIGNLLAEQNISEPLKRLKRNTNDFRILLQQSMPQKQGSHVSVASGQSKLRVGRYRRVQEAANNLYHAFGLACTKHTKHKARLKLQADHESPSQVQFTLLLEQKGALSSIPSGITQHPSLRLTIESQVTGTITNTDLAEATSGILASLSNCRKRGLNFENNHDQTEVKPSRKPRMSVGFASQSPIYATPAAANHDPLPNFCNNSNFCTHVKHLLNQGCRDGRPLGYLDSKGCSKHIIYLSSRTQTISLSTERRQHLTKFKTLYNDPERPLSKIETASLAKQLAVAVLQYHTTPWLEETWNSDHILIESDRSSKTASRQHNHQRQVPFVPYLDVLIHNPQEGARTPIADYSRTLIRNWTLYSLGIMLLELAYKKPIRVMQEAQDVDPLGNEHNTDYYTADRLQQSVSSEMSLYFAEVVRKCIQCDFGHGADLNATKLQEGFYEDVIQKLEDIEVRFKELGM